MASNTSITDFMHMTVIRFYETWQAIAAINERRAEKLKEKKHTGVPQPRRPRKRRR